MCSMIDPQARLRFKHFRVGHHFPGDFADPLVLVHGELAQELVGGVLAAPVAFEDVLQVVLADALTVVCDREPELGAAPLDPEGDVPAVGRGFGRVADQVGQDLEDAIAVAPDPRQVRLDLRADLRASPSIDDANREARRDRAGGRRVERDLDVVIAGWK